MNQLLKLLNVLASETPNLDANLGKFVFWIVICCFTIPIFTLLIIVVIKQILKHAKRDKRNQVNVGVNYLSMFGPSDNIVSVHTEMNRAIIEVVDVSLIDKEKLKELNIGIMISGNVIKCSSEAMVDALNKELKWGL